MITANSKLQSVMVGIVVLLLFFWHLAGCQSMLNYSTACGKCSAVTCGFDIGLAGDFTSTEEAVIQQALSAGSVLHPDWQVRM